MWKIVFSIQYTYTTRSSRFSAGAVRPPLASIDVDARCMRAAARTWERGQRAGWAGALQAAFSRLEWADTDCETTSSLSSGGWCVFRRRPAPRHVTDAPARPMLPSLSPVFHATSLIVFAMTYLQLTYRKYLYLALTVCHWGNHEKHWGRQIMVLGLANWGLEALPKLLGVHAPPPLSRPMRFANISSRIHDSDNWTQLTCGQSIIICL